MPLPGLRATSPQEDHPQDPQVTLPVASPPPKRGRGQPCTSRSPSLTPPPPPPPTKRGKGRPIGNKGKKKAPLRRQSPEASFDAQDQPDSPHSSICVTPRDSGRQPQPSSQPADPQVAAIQAIADQLARMQQEARDYQARSYTASSLLDPRTGRPNCHPFQRSPCSSCSQRASRPRHPAGWGLIVQRFHPPTVRRSNTLHRRGTAQESRIGPTAFTADDGPSRNRWVIPRFC